MLRRLLDFDPHTRITAAAAISHPYVAEFHDPDDEPTGEPFVEAIPEIAAPGAWEASIRKLIDDYQDAFW